MLVRETGPLEWTTAPSAGVSPITIFDLSELRGVVDTLRVACGLPAVPWAGSADDDATFAAGQTRVRAIHFNELRAAIDGLHAGAGLPNLPQFTGGPIVPGTRVIRLSDLLDLRGWTERFEALRPDLAARAVRLYGTYSDPRIAEVPEDKPTELWDATGLTRYYYDESARVRAEERVIDSHHYWTTFEYDDSGSLVALGYPDGRRVWWQYSRLNKRLAAFHGFADIGARVVEVMPTEEQRVAEITGGQETFVKRDARGRPVLAGEPARPTLRLAYDADGRLAKMVTSNGTTHLVGDHYERTVTLGETAEERIRRYVTDPRGERWLLDEPADKAGTISRMPEQLWRRARPILQSEPAADPADVRAQRDAIEGALHVLQRGGDWTVLPTGFPGGVVRDQVLNWQSTGLLERLWQAIGGHPALQGLDWTRLLLR